MLSTGFLITSKSLTPYGSVGSGDFPVLLITSLNSDGIDALENRGIFFGGIGAVASSLKSIAAFNATSEAFIL